MITEAHRRRAFAEMNEISDRCGYTPKSRFYDDVIKRGYNKAYETDFTMKPGVCTIAEYDRFMRFVDDMAVDVGARRETEAEALSVQMIKEMRYNADKGVLWVQFEPLIPGCNENGVMLFRVDDNQYADMMGQANKKQYFIDRIYGKCETVEL